MSAIYKVTTSIAGLGPFQMEAEDMSPAMLIVTLLFELEKRGNDLTLREVLSKVTFEQLDELEDGVEIIEEPKIEELPKL
jgi:hypothetical protein